VALSHRSITRAVLLIGNKPATPIYIRR